MKLLDIDIAINELMAKAADGEGTPEEIQFLKNLYHDLWELIPNL